MIKKLFEVTFYLFIIATVALTGFMVGPFSLRVPFGLASGALLVLSSYRPKLDLNLKLYFIFGLLFATTLIINGEFLQFNFIGYLVGKIILGAVMYYCVDYYVKDLKNVRTIMVILLVLAVANIFSSILQNNKNPLGDVISLALNRGADENVGFSESAIMNYYENALTVGVPGIFTDRVSNGYFSAFSVFLILFFIYDSRSFLSRVAFGVLLIPSVIVLFLSQQRSALAIGIFLLAVFMITKVNFRNPKTFIVANFCLIGLLSMLLLLPQASVELGRYDSYSDDSRERIYSASLDFIGSNFLIGGPVSMGKLINSAYYGIVSPHNFFLTAFGYSGLFGGVVITILYFRMLYTSIRNFHKFSYSGIIALMLLVYLLNSLFHNSGLMEGEGMIWLLFALLIKTSAIESLMEDNKNNTR